jgi:hypothetical protein
MLVIIAIFVFTKVAWHSWKYPNKAPNMVLVSELGLVKAYTTQVIYMGVKDFMCAYPPVWIKYCLMVKNNFIHFCINILLTFGVMFLVWRVMKFDMVQMSLLLILMTGGIFESYFSCLAQGNMTLFEMFFVWAGIWCLLKKSPFVILFFLLAGSIKFYYWIFSFLLLLERPKWFIYFILSVLGYWIVNFMVCPDCIFLQANNFRSYLDQAYPFGVLPEFVKFLWIFMFLIILILYAIIYQKTNLMLLLFICIIFAFAPRIMNYQYFFIAPVIVYLVTKVLPREVGILTAVYFAVPYAWNYHLLTAVMFAILCVMINHVANKDIIPKINNELN